VSDPATPAGTFARPEPAAAAGLARVTGVVVDRNGAPVAGATVRATDAEGRDALAYWMRACGPSPGRTASTARCDVAGRFTLELAAPGRFALRAEADGLTSPAHVVPAPCADLVLRVETAAFLEARVTDAEGRPVAGAQVRLAPADARGAPLDLADAVSDASGHVRCAPVPPGDYLVLARHPDYATTMRALQLPADGVLLTLRSGRRLRARVVGADGDPVPRVTVLLFSADPTGPPAFARTDEDGRVVTVPFPLHAGRIRIDAGARGLGALGLERWDESEEETLRLDPVHDVHALVVRDGAPVPGVVVRHFAWSAHVTRAP
jgi:protocatechuate 3,4-dioxygenase beta subunit